MMETFLDGKQFASLTQQLNMILLKSRELSASECIFAVQYLQYLHSSYSTGLISPSVGLREYATEKKSGADIVQIFKINQFDILLKYKTEGTIGEFASFHMDNRSRAT